MTTKRNKLVQLNIPELFYDRFVAGIPSGTSTVVDKLRNTPATKRGRGLTRVLYNLTEQEYNDVYQLAAKGRAAMKNADRQTTLFPAICAKSLADRMEIQGVANPVSYIPKKTTRRTKVAIEAARVSDAAKVLIAAMTPPKVPVDPPTLHKVNVPESTPGEQAAFQRDINLG